MAVENRNRLKLNIKYPFTQITTVTANDHNVFELEVWDGQTRVDLSEEYTYHLVTQPKNSVKHQIEDAFIREAALNEKGRVEVVLGHSETQSEGFVDCALQVYDEKMKRISTMAFQVKVIGDMVTAGIPATDRSLVVLSEDDLNERLDELFDENIRANVETIVNEKLEDIEGIIGADGKSAYQTWLDLGNIGNEQDFINSLQAVNDSLLARIEAIENQLNNGTPPSPPVNTAPSITSSFNLSSANTTDNITIPYTIIDTEGGSLTATYTKNGVTSTTTVSVGSNTWNVGTLTAGNHVLKIKVTDSGGLVSSELTFNLTVAQEVTPPSNERSVTFDLTNGELSATYLQDNLGVTLELVNGEVLAHFDSDSQDIGNFNITNGELLVTYPD